MFVYSLIESDFPELLTSNTSWTRFWMYGSRNSSFTYLAWSIAIYTRRIRSLIDESLEAPLTWYLTRFPSLKCGIWINVIIIIWRKKNDYDIYPYAKFQAWYLTRFPSLKCGIWINVIIIIWKWKLAIFFFWKYGDENMMSGFMTTQIATEPHSH
jgi:hypothetical protein